jgi:hypothetical protein
VSRIACYRSLAGSTFCKERHLTFNGEEGAFAFCTLESEPSCGEHTSRCTEESYGRYEDCFEGYVVRAGDCFFGCLVDGPEGSCYSYDPPRWRAGVLPD